MKSRLNQSMAIRALLDMDSARDNELYVQALDELHLLTYGPHYDAAHAIAAVNAMHSLNADGIVQSGEHWSYAYTIDAVMQYVQRMGIDDTIWDAYVAINLWWHHLRFDYIRRDLDDDDIINDAITWAFFDDDDTDGKVWRYMHALSRKIPNLLAC